MLARNRYYLDANAGIPPSSEVKRALQDALAQGVGFANPLSIHQEGRAAFQYVREAVDAVKKSIHASDASSSRVILTSSGSESNQLAIRAALEPALDRGESPLWLVSDLEHPSVLSLVPWALARGARISKIPVCTSGIVELEALRALWVSETSLLSIQWASSETGVIQPISEISSLRRGGLLHVDAVQAWGKVPIDLSTNNIDYLTLSGHKVGALSGSGALFVSSRAPVPIRIGTPSVSHAIALKCTSQLISQVISYDANWDLVRSWRDRFEEDVLARFPGSRIFGWDSPRTPNTSFFSIPGIDAEASVAVLDLKGYAVSRGAACQSRIEKPSQALQAMGVTEQEARGAIRVSLSRDFEPDGLKGFLSALEGCGKLGQ